MLNDPKRGTCSFLRAQSAIFHNGREDGNSIVSRVYNRKEGEYPTHYSTVYHPFTGVSDLSSIIHNLWYHTTR